MKQVHGIEIGRLKSTVGLPRDPISVFQRDRFACSYCGIQDRSADLLILDHAIPVERGGVHLAFNLRTACWICKKKKGKMTEEEFVGPDRAKRSGVTVGSDPGTGHSPGERTRVYEIEDSPDSRLQLDGSLHG